MSKQQGYTQDLVGQFGREKNDQDYRNSIQMVTLQSSPIRILPVPLTS
jgi:hypothetical protein